MKLKKVVNQLVKAYMDETRALLNRIAHGDAMSGDDENDEESISSDDYTIEELE